MPGRQHRFCDSHAKMHITDLIMGKHEQGRLERQPPEMTTLSFPKETTRTEGRLGTSPRWKALTWDPRLDPLLRRTLSGQLAKCKVASEEQACGSSLWILATLCKREIETVIDN